MLMSSSVPDETPHDDDLILVQAAQAGDLEAFDQLVMIHQSAISAVLFRFSSQRADLEDMVQETFLRAWRGLAPWRPDKPFIHWLKRIAVRIGLEFCRKHRRSPFYRLDDDGEGKLVFLTKESTTPAGDEAARILSHLPPTERAILTLLYLPEMPLAEIADHLGISLANAKIRAFRARAKLRKILTRHGYTYTTL